MRFAKVAALTAVALAFASSALAQDMGFVVFEGTTTGVVDSFYRTQALADAAAASEPGLTAVLGAQDLKGYSPSGAYWNGTELLDEEPPPGR